MHPKNVFYLIAVACFPYFMQAQVTSFQKIYPTTFDKTSRDIVQTPDGGYLIAGMANNTNITDCDLYVLKTNATGDAVSEYTFGGARPDYPYSMVATSDGNYFIVGYSQSFSAGDYDVYLVKVKPTGEKIFEKTFGSFGNEEGREIIATSDGNYMIVGSSSGFSGTQDAFLLKINVNGEEIAGWRRTYGTAGIEYGNSVKQCADGGYIIAGQTFASGQDKGDVYIVRVDASGSVTWTKTIGGVRNEEAICIVADGNGEFTFAVRDSHTNADQEEDVDIRLIRLSGAGDIILFDKFFGVPGQANKDTPKSLVSTPDGGYLMGCISRSFGWINPDMWLLKFNSSGDTTWSRHYGSFDHEHCHMARNSPDGGYLSVGHSKSFGPSQKIMFVKLDNSGMVSLQEQLFSNSLFNVHPNPSPDGIFTIQFKNADVSLLEVRNLLGQRLHYETITSSNAGETIKTIDLNGQQPGIYFVSIGSGDAIATKKIVLK